MTVYCYVGGQPVLHGGEHVTLEVDKTLKVGDVVDIGEFGSYEVMLACDNMALADRTNS